MCLLCGTSGDHRVTLSSRPAHRLVGLRWSGSDADAEAGALEPILAEVGRMAALRQGMWRSPIVALSWNESEDGFSYFAGFADDGVAPAGFDTVELPETEFADSWHGPDDGPMGLRYDAMLAWIADNGRSWDRSQFHQREEYPPDADPSASPALRLMLPLAPVAPRVAIGM